MRSELGTRRMQLAAVCSGKIRGRGGNVRECGCLIEWVLDQMCV